MTTLRQAAEQALEALNRNDYLGWQTNIHVREAIREALAQPEWVGLTREEMFECGGGMLNRDEERLCRYIEAKLKEKNT